jgi:hypothetical protein
MAALLRQHNFNLTPRGGAVGEVALEIQNDDYISRQISEYILPLFDDGRPGIEHAVLERSFQNSHLFCPLIWRVLRRAQTMERYRYLGIPNIPPQWDTYGFNQSDDIGRGIPINRDGMGGFVEDRHGQQQTLGLYFNRPNIEVWNEIVTRIVNDDPDFVDTLARAVIHYSTQPRAPAAPAPAAPAPSRAPAAAAPVAAAAPAPAAAAAHTAPAADPPIFAGYENFRIDGPNSGHIPTQIQENEVIDSILHPLILEFQGRANEHFEPVRPIQRNSHIYCPTIWKLLSHARILPEYNHLAIPEIPERWKFYGAERIEDPIGGGEFDAGLQTARFFFLPTNVAIWNAVIERIIEQDQNPFPGTPRGAIVSSIVRLVIRPLGAAAPVPAALPHPTTTTRANRAVNVARRPAAAVAESAVSVIPPAELAREPLVETNIPRIMLGDVNRLVFGQPFNSTRPPARANSERLLQTRRNTRLQAIRDRERGLQADAVAEAAAQAERNRIAAAEAAAQAERNRIAAAAAADQAERDRQAAQAAAVEAEQKRKREAAASAALRRSALQSQPVQQPPPSARRRTRKARKTRNRK